MAERAGFEEPCFRNLLWVHDLRRKPGIGKNLSFSSGYPSLRLFSSVCPLAWSQFGHKGSARRFRWLVSLAGNRHASLCRSNRDAEEEGRAYVNRSELKCRTPRLTPWRLRDAVACEWGRANIVICRVPSDDAE